MGCNVLQSIDVFELHGWLVWLVNQSVLIYF